MDPTKTLAQRFQEKAEARMGPKVGEPVSGLAPARVAEHDRAGWLALFSDDVVLEDADHEPAFVVTVFAARAARIALDTR